MTSVQRGKYPKIALKHIVLLLVGLAICSARSINTEFAVNTTNLVPDSPVIREENPGPVKLAANRGTTKFFTTLTTSNPMHQPTKSAESLGKNRINQSDIDGTKMSNELENYPFHSNSKPYKAGTNSQPHRRVKKLDQSTYKGLQDNQLLNASSQSPQTTAKIGVINTADVSTQRSQLGNPSSSYYSTDSSEPLPNTKIDQPTKIDLFNFRLHEGRSSSKYSNQPSAPITTSSPSSTPTSFRNTQSPSTSTDDSSSISSVKSPVRLELNEVSTNHGNSLVTENLNTEALEETASESTTTEPFHFDLSR